MWVGAGIERKRVKKRKREREQCGMKKEKKITYYYKKETVKIINISFIFSILFIFWEEAKSFHWFILTFFSTKYRFNRATSF